MEWRKGLPWILGLGLFASCGLCPSVFSMTEPLTMLGTAIGGAVSVYVGLLITWTVIWLINKGVQGAPTWVKVTLLIATPIVLSIACGCGFITWIYS